MLLALACIPDLHSPGGGADTGPSDTAPWIAPTNAWPSAEPPADLEGEGFDKGEVPPDFRLQDQNGDTVALWQFYGRVVVLDISTMWCAPCQALAEGLQATADAYADQGLTYLTVLPENVQLEVPSTEDLGDWVGAFDIVDQPVVADGTGWAEDAQPDPTQPTYPQLMVLGRDLKVAKKVGEASDEAVRDAVEAQI
jgi:thiol-disulfide isomerase/thioredoxin